MAIDKNKKLGKGKKGGRKKVIDPFTKKEWYDFKAPYPFDAASFGKTCITKTFGTKISTEMIKGRVVEASLSELKKTQKQAVWRKIKLMIEDVEGNACRTSFYGMDTTRDHLCRLIRKWHSLIETFVDVKTTDGFVLRVFVNCLTQRKQFQKCKTTYAQRSQIKNVRAKINEILLQKAS
jgi:small subunit ribosomal protein S3Ae